MYMCMSLYYERVEHKKGEPFMAERAEDDAEAACSGADLALITGVEALLRSSKHRAANALLRQRIKKACCE